MILVRLILLPLIWVYFLILGVICLILLTLGLGLEWLFSGVKSNVKVTLTYPRLKV